MEKIKSLFIILVIVLSLSFSIGCENNEENVDKSFATVRRENISEIMYANGTVEIEDYYYITAPYDMKISNVDVTKGNVVQENEIVITIDKTYLIQQLEKLTKERKQYIDSVYQMDSSKVKYYIKSSAEGTIKIENAEKGGNAEDILAYIITDNQLKIKTDSEKYNDGAVVKMSVGEKAIEQEGEYNSGFIYINNIDYSLGEEVNILDNNDTVIEKSIIQLSEYSELQGYYGDISKMLVDNNEEVSIGQNLFQVKSIPKDLVDALNNIEIVNNQIKELDDILENDVFTIVSEIEGVVADIAIQKGSIVKKESSLISIAKPNSFYVECKINELDLSYITEGNYVIVTVNANGQTNYEGIITEISNIGENSTSSNDDWSTFSAKIKISNTAGLKAGMTAHCSVIISEVNQALVLPPEAIYTNRDGKYYVIKDGEKHYISIGIRSESAVQVILGLQEGDEVEIERQTSIYDSIYYE